MFIMFTLVLESATAVVLKRLNEKQSFHMLSSNNKLFLILDKT